MTIVAGFHVRDGILLCADTMYSSAIKIHQQKIFPVSFSGSLFAFALAGNEMYARIAIEECQNAIETLPREQRSLKNVRRALREAVKSTHEEYVDARPTEERESAQFQLVIGSWLELGGGPHLFWTSGAGLTIEHEYQCVGSGAYLGHYLIRGAYNRGMGLDNAITLAIQTVAAAKAYDANCGGNTQFISITGEPSMSPLHDYDVYHSEIYIREYEGFSRKLLFQIANSQIGDEEFARRIDEFVRNVKFIRESWKSNADARQALLRSLAPFKREAKSSPGSTTHDLQSPPASQG